MTVNEIDNKLVGLHKKGIELADEIEFHQNEVEAKRSAYEENLRHISALITAKVKIQTVGKELAKFEPKEVS